MARRNRGHLALVAGLAAVAVGVGSFLVITRDDDTAQRVSTDPPIRIGSEPATRPELTRPAAELVARTVLDPTIDAEVAAAAIDADDAAGLIVHIRMASATAGVTSSDVVHVGIEVAAGDRASVDAWLATGGSPAGRAASTPATSRSSGKAAPGG